MIFTVNIEHRAIDRLDGESERDYVQRERETLRRILVAALMSDNRLRVIDVHSGPRRSK